MHPYSGKKATFAANPCGCREATLAEGVGSWVWRRLGLCQQPPGAGPTWNTFCGSGVSWFPVCTPRSSSGGVHVLWWWCRHDKIRSQSVMARTDLESTTMRSDMHPSVCSDLRAPDCPQTWPPRCCSVPRPHLGQVWGLGQPSGAQPLQSLREQSLEEKPCRTPTLPGTSEPARIHGFFPLGKRTTAAQIKNTVNTLLWFIRIFMLIIPECIFSKVFDASVLLLKVVGLRDSTGAGATSEPSRFLIKSTGRHKSQRPIALLFIRFEKLQHVKYSWGASVIGYNEQEYRNYFCQIHFVHRNM